MLLCPVYVSVFKAIYAILPKQSFCLPCLKFALLCFEKLAHEKISYKIVSLRQNLRVRNSNTAKCKDNYYTEVHSQV